MSSSYAPTEIELPPSKFGSQTFDPTYDNTLVLDYGSFDIRLGTAGSEYPVKILPTEPSRMSVLKNTVKMDIQGIEKDVQNYTEKYNLNLVENSLLFADPVGNSRFNKVKLMEIFMEKLNLYEVNFANQGCLSLYAHARLTGLVVDSGLFSTRVVPIVDGCYIKNGKVTSSLSGNFIDEKLKISLGNLERDFSRSQVQKIKHKICYVKKDQNHSVKDETFKLPDGKDIVFKQEHLCEPIEDLFNNQEESLQFLAKTSINSCELDLRRNLAGNIVLQGGNACFSGLANRFTKELNNVLASKNVKTLTFDKKDRASTVWIGGSILASLSHNTSSWMKKSDYHEFGPMQLISRNNSVIE